MNILDKSNILACQKCNGFYLHHGDVEIFNRISEDSETGIHVKIEDQSAFTDTKMVGNPSSRRNGLLIEFNCENCANVNILSIYQHKGNSYIEWLKG